MAEYQPTSRRPIAEVFRRTARAAASFCVRNKIHADAISYLSIVAATAAAGCFLLAKNYPAMLIVAPLFCYARLWCNMLDGMVAIAARGASARGEILNDLPDRISDLIIFAGAAHSGWMHPLVGYWCALLALLTAYVGLLGQAIGVRREFIGVMSKPWRMVALHLGAWFAVASWISNRDVTRFFDGTILDWFCLAIVVGCLQTSVVRLRKILCALRKQTPA